MTQITRLSATARPLGNIAFPVRAKPVIDTQPVDTTVDEVSVATFTVAATASQGTLLYQWYDASDDSVVIGETAATFDFTTALTDNGNTYYVIVTDDFGSVQSSTVTLTVNDIAPVITTQPVAATVDEYGAWRPFVTATGTGTLTYQWYWAADDSIIVNAIESTLLVAATVENSGKEVYVIVTDVTGSIQSNTVGLTVTPKLTGSSSCLVNTSWDFASGAISGRISRDIQMYRIIKQQYAGYSVLSTRNKIRGRGHAFAMQMRTEPGKDCKILGWNFAVAGNRNV